MEEKWQDGSMGKDACQKPDTFNLIPGILVKMNGKN